MSGKIIKKVKTKKPDTSDEEMEYFSDEENEFDIMQDPSDEEDNALPQLPDLSDEEEVGLPQLSDHSDEEEVGHPQLSDHSDEDDNSHPQLPDISDEEDNELSFMGSDDETNSSQPLNIVYDVEKKQDTPVKIPLNVKVVSWENFSSYNDITLRALNFKKGMKKKLKRSNNTNQNLLRPPRKK